jgi:hypothetical protein
LLNLLRLELKLGKLLCLGLELLRELRLLRKAGFDILLNCRKLRLRLLACRVGCGELLLGGSNLRLELGEGTRGLALLGELRRQALPDAR